MNLMQWFEASGNTLYQQLDKHVVMDTLRDELQRRGFTIVEEDRERPWGGFIVLAEADAARFAEEFFPDSAVLRQAKQGGLKLTPKLLVVQGRLSLQRHKRRSEVHCMAVGPVNYLLGDNADDLRDYVFETSDTLRIGCGQLHRLYVTEGIGVVAEMWLHEDVTNPSNERDVERLEDDYGRT